MATVTLYYFEGYDFHEDRVVRSGRPATPEFIARYGLRRVEDNAVEVDSSQVDADGMLAGDS
jgi:hypothetical protein